MLEGSYPVTAYSEGASGVDEDGGNKLMFVSSLVPGINEAFEVHFKKHILESRTLKLRCQTSKFQNSLAFAKPDQIAKVEILSTLRRPPMDLSQVDLTLGADHFRERPTKPLELVVVLNSEGHETEKEPVEMIKYNGLVTLIGHSLNCTLPDRLIIEKGFQPLKLAQQILAGVYRSLTCKMNGGVGADGKLQLVFWASDFDLQK